MKHCVCDLVWADWGQSPGFARARGANSATRAGLAYEQKAGTVLAQMVPLLAGPWIHFQDGTGKHWAQPDLIINPQALPGSPILLLETKLNFRRTALEELEQLYVPLVSHLYHGLHPVIPGVLCKRLTPEARGLNVINLVDLTSVEEIEPWSVLTWDAKTLPQSFEFPPGKSVRKEREEIIQ